MKKIDWSVAAEIIGVGLVAFGLGMVSIPLALVTVGGFLVWITEKN